MNDKGTWEYHKKPIPELLIACLLQREQKADVEKRKKGIK